MFCFLPLFKSFVQSTYSEMFRSFIYSVIFWVSFKSFHIAFFSFDYIYFFIFLIVVQVQWSSFSPHHGPLPQPSPPPILEPTPFGFVHVSFVHVPWWHFPYFPPLSPLPPPLWSLSVCSLFQCHWLCSACLFVLLIRFHL